MASLFNRYGHVLNQMVDDTCILLRILDCYTHYVHDCLFVSKSSPVVPHEIHSSYGAIVLDHLAADGTGLAGGQVAVVALLEVDADLV